MVQLKEFRIVMPMSVEEFEVAQLYMVFNMQRKTATSTEGIEILESRPFEDNIFGKGHYTSKLYQFESKVPSWITSFAPADALILQEEAWNAYPKCKSGLLRQLDHVFISVIAYFGGCADIYLLFWCRFGIGYLLNKVIKCPYFEKLLLTIETVHVADSGQSENVHGLTKQQLELREVEVIDIASAIRDYWSYLVGCCDVDFSRFRSSRTGRGPLLEGWQNQCSPVMTAYKLVTVDAPYWGFGRRIEQTLISGERALFLETHRHCFSWIDDWYGMTTLQLRELEKQYNSLPAEERLKSPSAKTLGTPKVSIFEESFKHGSRLEPEEHMLRCPNS